MTVPTVPTVLTLRHTPAEGTTLAGTRKNDGTGQALRSVRHVAVWRFSRALECWFIPRSRDRQAYSYQLDETVKALRAAGFEVVVERGDERRPVAEREAERAGRAEARTERQTERAATLRAAGEAGWAAAREIASRLPLGQPVLVDHYSAPGYRRLLARIDRMENRAIDQVRAGDEAARRAESAAQTQSHREHGATTMRRIQRLEADLRRVQRGQSTQSAEDLEEQLAYWRGHLRGLEEAGVYRVWTSKDFTRATTCASATAGPRCDGSTPRA
ncbi:hypothetical protein BJF78_34680 [Pseudonocardia sp. CNS-139]|nr:hypothetical protein BJF78_34680 [Pseudonocardia sp. CNS-139]